MSDTNLSQRSSFLFLITIGALVISTLVFFSAYFVKPLVETELKNKLLTSFTRLGITSNLVKISGRDITLSGSVKNKEESIMAENAALAIQGIRQVNNKLLIKNQTIE